VSGPVEMLLSAKQSPKHPSVYAYPRIALPLGLRVSILGPGPSMLIRGISDPLLRSALLATLRCLAVLAIGPRPMFSGFVRDLALAGPFSGLVLLSAFFSNTVRAFSNLAR
jgi:hypothetical protein